MLFFSGGGGAKMPPNYSGTKFLGYSFCSLQGMCIFCNLFRLVTSEIVERRKIPFSKHFTGAFFENLFFYCRFFRCPALAKILRLEMLSKNKYLILE